MNDIQSIEALFVTLTLISALIAALRAECLPSPFLQRICGTQPNEQERQELLGADER